jgi:carboxymethylenebutenolidase
MLAKQTTSNNKSGDLAMDTPAEFDSLLPASHLSRRDFVITAAAAGFALAVQPVCAQTAISTPAEGLATGDAGIPVPGGTLPIYFARPAKGTKLPTVLVVQEIFGLHEYIRDVCRRLAKLGYLAVAPALYFRQGDPTKAESIPAILSQIVSKVPDAQVLADLDACATWAAGNSGDPARLAITGFCWGGRIVWLYAAHNPKLKAGVAWYGQLRGAPSPLTPTQPLDIAGQIRVPVLGLYGARDEGIDTADMETMNDALKSAGGPSEIHIYPDSGHAFHADYRPSYNAKDAEDGWKRLTAWFKKYV